MRLRPGPGKAARRGVPTAEASALPVVPHAMASAESHDVRPVRGLRTQWTGVWIDRESVRAKARAQQQLADACGVGRMAIHRWANGDRTPAALVRRAVNAMARRRGIAEPWPDESRP